MIFPGTQPRSEGFVPAQLAIGNTNSANEPTTILNFQASQVDLATVSIQTPSSPISQSVVNHESSTVVSPFQDTPSSLPNTLPTIDIIGASIRNGSKPLEKCLHAQPGPGRRRCRRCACKNPCTCRDSYSCECANAWKCCRRKIRY